MLATPLLALALATAAPGCTIEPSGPAASPLVSDSLVALYGRGKTWDEFLEAAKARRDTWVGNYGMGPIDSTAAVRATAITGRWRFLVVAEDWCGDSANTIPFLARLVEASPALEMRIVNSTDGRAIMEAHRTEDGRAATPTVILLDEQGVERGCWVERPYALRQRLKENTGDRMELLTSWRREDRGRSTVTDLLDLVETVAGGATRCP